MRKLELLAPARNAEIARQAILHGADAVYMGGPSHGARAAAGNSLADIKAVADFAHRFGARIYVTLNTIIYDSELEQVRRLFHELWQADVDALIVQDMGILRMQGLPPIALHASTQCDIRTPEKAVFLAECGFSQLVLPREFSLQEIEETRKALPPTASIEAFVHGALCVCYSGDCQASQAALGRSANRGECAQMCRMAYDLTDADGNVLIKDKHLLSLRDMSHLADLEDMALAGVDSFKIEGRLKDAAYVKQVVGEYRRRLDSVIAKHPGLFARASQGVSSLTFTPNAAKAFNRGLTPYFIRPDQVGKMACFDTPKSIGEKVGTVRSVQGAFFTAKLTADLANGDGLGFFNRRGVFAGFRLNSIKDGGKLFPASKVQGLEPGMTLYRNLDSKLALALAAPNTATRTIEVDLTLWAAPAQLALRMEVPGGAMATVTAPYEPQAARSPQHDVRSRELSRLGGTIFTARNVDDRVAPTLFVPASTLAALRRDAAALLLTTILTTHQRQLRLPENLAARLPEPELTYHANIANALARQFYLDHGATATPPALEVSMEGRQSMEGRLPACPRPHGPMEGRHLACPHPNGSMEGRLPACPHPNGPMEGRLPACPSAQPKEGIAVMTTRYCLRRELGACLRTSAGAKLPRELYLRNRAATYRLDFDCKNCRMRLLTTKNQ